MGRHHDHGVGAVRAGERHRGRRAVAFGLTQAAPDQVQPDTHAGCDRVTW
jgi:hypothetical protein